MLLLATTSDDIIKHVTARNTSLLVVHREGQRSIRRRLTSGRLIAVVLCKRRVQRRQHRSHKLRDLDALRAAAGRLHHVLDPAPASTRMLTAMRAQTSGCSMAAGTGPEGFDRACGAQDLQ